MKALTQALLAVTAGLAILSAHAAGASADLDGDGNSDVLWRNATTGENYVYLMDGLSIVDEGNLRTVADPAWQVVGMGDFNADGRADVLWRNTVTGENYTYLMQGRAVLGEGYVRTVPLEWQVAGVGDFDGDGKADILWRNHSTGENYLYLMDGTGIRNEGYIRTVEDQNWHVAGIGDFNGDGQDDILWRNRLTGENYLYPMNGLAIKPGEGHIRSVADPGWHIAATGDYDGDGTADILWRNRATGENYLYPMNGLVVGPGEGYIRSVTDLSWQIVGAGDYDGDARSDILWRHASSGENYLYPMDGKTIKATEGYIRTVPDSNWQVVPAALDEVAPSTPAALTATAVSASRINLSWFAATDNVGVTGYLIFRNGTHLATVGNVTTYASTGLTASTTYSYAVRALDAAGNVSGLSNSASATTAAPDTVAPSTPTGLVATAVSSSTIDLSWSASTDNVAVTGYRVIRNGSLLTTLGNVTTFQDTGLNPVTTYTYRVRALDAAGNVSPQSTAASATTLAMPDTVAPTTPTGLAATPVSDTRIGLSWTPSTDNVAVTGYRVYRNGDLLTTLGNVTAHEDSGLVPSTTYSYSVAAIDAAGNASGISTASSATTLAVTTATLAWDAVVAGNLSGYRVYYGTAPGTYLQAKGAGQPVAGNVTTHTVTGLSRGTQYYFAVTAFDALNKESIYSNEVSKVIP